jgi:hypothetical protein
VFKDAQYMIDLIVPNPFNKLELTKNLRREHDLHDRECELELVFVSMILKYIKI